MVTENKIVVVVKAFIIRKAKVLIVKRTKKDNVGADTWECAGGKIEFGENLEDALIRETKEETGLDIKVERILYAATFKTDPARQVVILTYLCSCDEIDVTLSEEHTEFQWSTSQQLRQLLPQGILDDFMKYELFTLLELE